MASSKCDRPHPFICTSKGDRPSDEGAYLLLLIALSIPCTYVYRFDKQCVVFSPFVYQIRVSTSPGYKCYVRGMHMTLWDGDALLTLDQYLYRHNTEQSTDAGAIGKQLIPICQQTPKQILGS